ncbi:MAG: osmotically inducible protein C [Elusimicrobia bacterium]|nr:MAG: osmotically inducible protein C [Elusimicrobiota bacterium]
MRTEKFEFQSISGNQLAAKLEMPAGEPKAWALFAHCFTCSKDSLAVSRISRALGRRGVAVVRFDFTGLGGSEGDFANTNFSSNLMDLAAAADHMRRKLRPPDLLIGHSFGGAAVIAAASKIPEAKAVAVLGSPSETDSILRHMDTDAIKRDGVAEIEILGRPFKIKKQFLDDVSGPNLFRHLGRMQCELFVLHSPDDEIVGFSHAQRLFEAAKGPKSFLALPGADHLLTDRRDAEYVAEVISAWAERRIADPKPEEYAPVPGVIRVAETGRKYHQRIHSSEHAIDADEPRPMSEDAGMSPYDLLLSSLGACTSMTLRMYAHRKEWPLESVSVELKHRKIHVEDCADCETETGKIDSIEREIKITGNLDQSQRARLLEIADRCPVHKTLHAEIKVSTKLI